jgi:peptidylprolyl isomerase
MKGSGRELAGENTREDNMKRGAVIFLISLFVIALGIAGYYMAKANNTETISGTKVELTTNYGRIVLLMYADMPITTGNFVKLVNDGFYDGVIFHRIIPNFMIQGGDPLGNGMGGPGYTIKDEFTHAGGNRNKIGTISMANAGPNTGGSQFFINLVDNSFLDSKHPAFGEVIEGMDVVNKIAKVETKSDDKPLKDVVIEKAKVL